MHKEVAKLVIDYVRTRVRGTTGLLHVLFMIDYAASKILPIGRVFKHVIWFKRRAYPTKRDYLMVFTPDTLQGLDRHSASGADAHKANGEVKLQGNIREYADLILSLYQKSSRGLATLIAALPEVVIAETKKPIDIIEIWPEYVQTWDLFERVSRLDTRLRDVIIKTKLSTVEEAARALNEICAAIEQEELLDYDTYVELSNQCMRARATLSRVVLWAQFCREVRQKGLEHVLREVNPAVESVFEELSQFTRNYIKLLIEKLCTDSMSCIEFKF